MFPADVMGSSSLPLLSPARLVALNAGSRPLVDMNSDNKMEIVLEEIKQDKIFLDTSNELRTAADGDVMIKSFDAMMSDEL